MTEKIPAVKARPSVKTGVMRYVLALSLFGSIIALILVWLWIGPNS
jgi:hypothetical protein